MKFTHNHPGPWFYDGYDIRDSCTDTVVLDCDDILNKACIPLIEQAPAMRDKLIEIAQVMEEKIELHERARAFRTENRELAGKLKQELALILEILILAGVEVEI